MVSECRERYAFVSILERAERVSSLPAVRCAVPWVLTHLHPCGCCGDLWACSACACLVLLAAFLTHAAGACGPAVTSPGEVSAERDFLTPAADLFWTLGSLSISAPFLRGMTDIWGPLHTTQKAQDTGCRHRSIHLNTSQPFQNYFPKGTMWPQQHTEHGVEVKVHPTVPDSTSIYLGFLMSCPSYTFWAKTQGTRGSILLRDQRTR